MELLSKSGGKKNKSIVTEITSEEENEQLSEWQEFQNLSRERKLKKVNK